MNTSFNLSIPKLPVVPSLNNVFPKATESLGDSLVLDLQNQFINYDAHVPRILKSQLISRLISQRINVLRNKRLLKADASQSSIERFHGVLLLVDISGFTSTSVRLDVETFKNHINNYFSSMLNIVEDFEGDVIKFAGDALFILWQTNVKQAGTDQAAIAVEKAISCALQISEACNNYAIYFDDVSGESSSPVNTATSVEKSKAFAQHYLTTNGTTSVAGAEKSVVYLNVHSGISVGTLAGIDVGSDNRWEYFLVGDPLVSVFQAQKLATAGELIGSKEILDVFATSLRPEYFMSFFDFTINDKGYYRITAKHSTPTPKLTMSKSSAAAAMEVYHSPSKRSLPMLIQIGTKFLTAEQGRYLADKHRRDTVATAATTCISSDESRSSNCGSDSDNEDSVVIEKERDTFDLERVDCIDDEDEGEDDEDDSESDDMFTISNDDYMVNKSESFRRDEISKFLRENVNNAIEKHIHEVVRTNMSVNSSMLQGFQSFSLADQSHRSHGSHGSSGGVDSNPVSPSNSMQDKAFDSILTSELRQVVVLFIKIHMNVRLEIDITQRPMVLDKSTGSFNVEANISPRKSSSGIVQPPIPEFSFLPRTHTEYDSDQALLRQLQSCFSIISKAFSSTGGQIRQFIVDDKGTVCIGSFGLRGSSTENNSSVAAEVASTIIRELKHQLSLQASIGITSGKAYCGLVGSSSRHEYAIMGRSTNLSARLMVAASPGMILCDHSVKHQDRFHDYHAATPILAKGYQDSVNTYIPVFSSDEGDEIDSIVSFHSASHSQRSTSQRSISLHEGLQLITENSTACVSILPSGDGTPKHKSPLRRLSHKSYFADEPVAVTAIAGKLRAMSGSNVLDPGTESDSSDTDFSHIHGRTREADAAIRFIFPEQLVAKFAGDLSILDSINSSRGGAAGGGSSSMKKVKLLIFEGSYGSGLSSMLDYTCQRIFLNEKKRNKANARNTSIYFTASNSVDTTTAFLTWKSIFVQFFINIIKLIPSTFSPRTTSAEGKSAAAAAIAALDMGGKTSPKHGSSMSQQDSNVVLNKAIDYALSMMSANHQKLKPLLNGFLLPKGKDNETTGALFGLQRVKRMIELLAAILQKCTEILNQNVIIAIDDMQSMDSRSWALLRYVWDNNTGISIIGGFRQENALKSAAPNVTSFSKSNSSNAASQTINLDHEVKQTFNDPKRMKRIAIGALDKISMSFLVCNALELDTFDPVNDVISDKIFELSGGNPLYAMELIKTIVSKCSTQLLSDMSVDEMMYIVQSLKPNHRIEEIVYFQFDRLSPEKQLIIKVASVAGLNGGCFTSKMLEQMLPINPLTPRTPRMPMNRDVSFHSSTSGGTGFASPRPSMSEFYGSELNVSAILNELVQYNMFLIEGKQTSSAHDIRNQLKKYNNNADMNVECEELLEELDRQNNSSSNADYTPRRKEEKLYQFRSTMAQVTIYDVMLESQKSVLHEKLASFLECFSLNVPTEQVTITHWSMQGLHWEKANVWRKAMTCYYNAGKLLQEQGSSAESKSQLISAYWMFCEMRKAAGLNFRTRSDINPSYNPFFVEPISPTISNLRKKTSSISGSQELLKLSLLDDGVAARFSPTMRGGSTSPNHHSNHFQFNNAINTPRSVSSSQLQQELETLSQEDILRIFSGIISDLEIAVNLLVKLAQCLLTMNERSDVVASLYYEALQLVMTTKVQTTSFAEQLTEEVDKNNNNIVNTPQSARGAAKGSVSARKRFSLSLFMPKNFEQQNSTSPVTVIDTFALKDFTTLFPVLSGLVLLYSLQYISDVTSKTKKRNIIKLFSTLAFQSGSQVHILRSLTATAWLHYDVQDYMQALDTIDSMLNVYEFTSHHADLISFYDADRVLESIAFGARIAVLSGAFQRYQKYCKFLLAILPQVQHLTTIALTIISLTDALMMCGEYDTALSLFHQYKSLEFKWTGYSMLHSFLPAYIECSRKTLEIKEKIDSSHKFGLLSCLFGVDSIVYDEQSNFTSHVYDDLLDHDRILKQQIDIETTNRIARKSGRGLEVVQAELCILRANYASQNIVCSLPRRPSRPELQREGSQHNTSGSDLLRTTSMGASQYDLLRAHSSGSNFEGLHREGSAMSVDSNESTSTKSMKSHTLQLDTNETKFAPASSVSMVQQYCQAGLQIIDDTLDANEFFKFQYPLAYLRMLWQKMRITALLLSRDDAVTSSSAQNSPCGSSTVESKFAFSTSAVTNNNNSSNSSRVSPTVNASHTPLPDYYHCKEWFQECIEISRQIKSPYCLLLSTLHMIMISSKCSTKGIAGSHVQSNRDCVEAVAVLTEAMHEIDLSNSTSAESTPAPASKSSSASRRPVLQQVYASIPIMREVHKHFNC